MLDRHIFILIADDNRDLADTMARLLELSGFGVRVAYDGLAAVQAAEAHQPDILLLDIGMPGLNGFEVASRFRRDERLRTVFIIAISAYNPDLIDGHASRGAFDRRCLKPVAFPELLSMLQETIPLLSA